MFLVFFTFVLFTVCDGQNFVKPCKNFIIITVLNVFNSDLFIYIHTTYLLSSFLVTVKFVNAI